MSSPGVPNNLPIVVASSATPILVGSPLGSTVGTSSMTTETKNVWPQVLIERGVVVSPFKSSTPIVLPSQVGMFPSYGL
jgi:hypothetical protein